MARKKAAPAPAGYTTIDVAIRNGMTKQRAKSGGGRTLRLDVSVAFAHMRDTIRYIALSEAVDNTYRLISHPDVSLVAVIGVPDEEETAA